MSHTWKITVFCDTEEGEADLIKTVKLSVSPIDLDGVDIEFCDCCGAGVYKICREQLEFNVANNCWHVPVFYQPAHGTNSINDKIKHWVKAGFTLVSISNH